MKTRLQILTPFISTWSQALAILALPQNLPKSVESLAILVDEMWYQAGVSHTNVTFLFHFFFQLTEFISLF